MSAGKEAVVARLVEPVVAELAESMISWSNPSDRFVSGQPVVAWQPVEAGGVGPEPEPEEGGLLLGGVPKLRPWERIGRRRNRSYLADPKEAAATAALPCDACGSTAACACLDDCPGCEARGLRNRAQQSEVHALSREVRASEVFDCEARLAPVKATLLEGSGSKASAPPPVARTLDMLEDGRIVVRHVFYGRDEAEARHMERAHIDADASLRASVQGKPYKGTDIKAVRRESEGGRGSNQYAEKPGGAKAGPKADPHELAAEQGVEYNGVQQGWGVMPDQALFTDPAHGSTFAVQADQVSRATLRQAIDRKRKQFGVRAVLAEGGMGSGIRGHVNPALTAEARRAYEGDGSNQYTKRGGRSKFAPAGHEPDEGVRVEPKAVRAQRIRSMKVDPVRAEIIKRAIGMRASLVA